MSLVLSHASPKTKKQILDSLEEDVFVFPTSFAQQRLWFLDQLEAGNPAYNLPFVVRLTGSLNVIALEQAFNEIVQRHESLRTTFANVKGQPVQIISDPEPFPLRLIDLEARFTSAMEREAEAQRLAIEEIQRSFDLVQGPLFRIILLRLDEEDHILLLMMHHIISDDWSVGVFLRETTVLYQAFSNGIPSPLPELAIQYADFTLWQQQWLQGEVLEAQLSYWKQQLAGAPPVLELATDRPRPAVQTFRGASQPLMLSKSLIEALKTLSRQEGATLFMTLLATFQILLSRYSGQEDIIVGSPIAGRSRVQVEGLIGFFVNTLVLRTDLSDNPSFRELLRRVRKVTLEAYDHQDLPFEKLVEELQPARDLSRNPLFQVMFTLQHTSMLTLELPNLRVSPLKVEDKTAKFDLTLGLVETAEGLEGSLEYNTELFNETTISRMANHFQTLLTGIVANPEAPISYLPLLTKAEEQQLLVEWNDTATEYPQDKCIHHLFEAQVERTPEATAVVFENNHMTYQELNCRANQLARHLQALGVISETVIGIYMERSLEMIVGILGILKAGGAYIPLDPGYPEERLTYMLKDTGMPILLTQQRLLKRLPPHQAKVLCLDTEDWQMVANYSTENLGNGTTSRNLAYVIYTSGSTGNPKGVMVEHRSTINLLTSLYQSIYSSQSNCSLRMSLNAPLAFDSSIKQLIFLLKGHTLFIIPDEIRTEGEALLQYIRYNALDVLDCTPSHLRILLAAGLLDEAYFAPSLVLVGGEAIDEAMWQILAQAPKTKFYNVYGPTECTVDATACHIQTSSIKPIIGRPLANYQIYVLNQHLQPVPIGGSGELYIGGTGLARGYLNRSELTAEKFIPNPFSDRPGDRMYKTGDLVRYLPDGNIEFLGRVDYQVKIRGFRIELGEIEAILDQHPVVQQAVVLSREDVPGDKRLVAYITPKQGAALTITELRQFLKEKLPNYMMPSAFVLLDTLPLTTNGKIDRQALPAPEQVRQELEKTFVAPRDELELQLTRTWEQVLGIQPIGIRDNFFEVGGHSLLAVRLLTHIEKIIGQELSPTFLFQAPTVEQLANVLRERQRGQSLPTSSLVALQPYGSKPPLFCIPGNLGNVFVDFSDLAWYLGQDQPFYGLQDNIHNPFRVTDLAAHYLNEIRAIQPEGPYLLGGVCSGGVVAFEIAQQLQTRGQQVAFLALIEPSSPRGLTFHSYNKFIVSICRRLLRRFGDQSRNVLSLTHIEKKAYLRLKLKVIANIWAVAHYTPQLYEGQIDLFLTSASLEANQDSPLEWLKFTTGGMEVHEIPGTHDTIVGDNNTKIEEAHMQVLAEQLRICINKVLLDGHRT